MSGESEFGDFLSPIEDIIEDARNGRMFILVDAEDRENEGDLVIPAQMATPEMVNFMARHGRGLICLSLPPERAAALDLRYMSHDNQTRHQTAFTVSIEAKHGVSTGISAHDRSHTIATAIDPTKGREDIVTPGHVFPLVAKEGGVLVRAGHTEAAVDIARLAGLQPAGVICEIMNDDGSMARLPDLVKFAQLHGMKVGTIEDLIAYRRRYDNLVHCETEMPFKSRVGGEWQLKLYVNKEDHSEHVVLVKGDISGSEPVMVRMHALSVFSDILGVESGPENLLPRAMDMIAQEGRGVVVLLRETEPTALSDLLVHRKMDLHPPQRLREYGIGAQILLDLGLSKLISLSNTSKTVVGLDGYGLSIVETRPIP